MTRIQCMIIKVYAFRTTACGCFTLGGMTEAHDCKISTIIVVYSHYPHCALQSWTPLDHKISVKTAVIYGG